MFNPCCCGCTIYARDNNFTADDLAGYDQRAGSWSISGTYLVGSATGKIILADPGTKQVSVRVPYNSGIILLGWLDDDNYLFCRHEITAGGMRILIGKVVAGVETILGRVMTSSGSQDILATYDVASTTLCASVFRGTGITNYNASAVVAAPGQKVGLGTLASGATFTRFKVEKNQSGCDQCKPSCIVFEGYLGSEQDLTDFMDVVSGSWSFFGTGLYGGILAGTAAGTILFKRSTETELQFLECIRALYAPDLSPLPWTWTARFLINYLDEDNYHYAEVVSSTSAHSPMFTLGIRSGGVDTTISTGGFGTNAAGGGAMMTSQTINAGNYGGFTTPIAGGLRMGIKLLSGTIYLDRLYARGAGDLDSPSTVGVCEDVKACDFCQLTTDSLTLVVSGFTGTHCSQFNGTYGIAPLPAPAYNSSPCRLASGSVALIDPFDSGGITYTHFAWKVDVLPAKCRIWLGYFASATPSANAGLNEAHWEVPHAENVRCTEFDDTATSAGFGVINSYCTGSETFRIYD